MCVREVSLCFPMSQKQDMGHPAEEGSVGRPPDRDAGAGSETAGKRVRADPCGKFCQEALARYAVDFSPTQGE